MLEAQKMARDISRLFNEISNIHLADAAWKTNLGSCKERLLEKQGELDRCDSRLALLKRMRQSPSCDVWPRCVPNSHALAIAASLTSEQDTAEFCSQKGMDRWS